jgi:putative DNA primase/helicase
MAKTATTETKTKQPTLADKVKVVPITKTDKNVLPAGFYFSESGLYFDDPNSDSTSPLFICSRLEITAKTRDVKSDNWGRVLEFKDPDGKQKKWVMPMEMLSGRGDLLHATLLNMGLNLNTSGKAKNLLSQYIQLAEPDKKAVCVDRVGWFEGCYVLPNETLGDTKGREILLQTAHPDGLGFEQKGTLKDWQENVAKFAVENSRLAFAISASFAAPLLEYFGIEGGGFHFRGESSQGKTISLYTAGSVWGNHARKQTWRATSNGLEETAFNHNDKQGMIEVLNTAMIEVVRGIDSGAIEFHDDTVKAMTFGLLSTVLIQVFGERPQLEEVIYS